MVRLYMYVNCYVLHSCMQSYYDCFSHPSAVLKCSTRHCRLDCWRFFLWRFGLHCFVGQLWYVTPGSRGDRFVMLCIVFWLVHMTLYCTDKLIYIWVFSLWIFRFNSVTEYFSIVGLNSLIIWDVYPVIAYPLSRLLFCFIVTLMWCSFLCHECF